MGILLTRISMLLALFLILSACSTVKLLYPKLDWIIPHYIDDYVSLNDAQALQLDQSLQEILDWHCTTAVKQYATWLERIRVDIENKALNKQKIADYMAESSGFWHDLSAQAVPKIAPILISVDTAQIEQLFEKFSQKNTDNQQNYIDIPFVDLRLKLLERMQQRFERWLGDLNPKQIEAIDRWSYGATKRTRAWVASRLKWQQTLRDILTLKPQSQSTASLTKLLQHPDSLWTETYRAERLASRRDVKKILLVAYETMLPEQQHYLIEQLDGWATDIDSLSCVD